MAFPRPGGHGPAAPFPYSGGKRRWAARVWRQLGNVESYCEPFAGSLAVLLARPGGAGNFEVVGDADGLLCNFWRALSADPEQVAFWADWPTVQHDLTARQRWLISWRNAHADRLADDPDFYHAQAAGWWVWGVCSNITPGYATADAVGCFPQCGGGRGVAARRMQLRGSGGPRGQRLHQWFGELAARLHPVTVINGDWQKCLTSAALYDYYGRTVGVFLDPPYTTTRGRGMMYGSDRVGTSDATAAEAWIWAREHGDRYRIAYACYAGDVVDPPEGWAVEVKQLKGLRTVAAQEAKRDCVLFSPACLHAGEGMQPELLPAPTNRFVL